MRTIKLYIMAVVLLLSGCDLKETYKSFLAEEKGDAEAVLSLFIEKNIEGINSQLHPSLQGSQNQEKLIEVANFFPNENPLLVEAIGSNTFSSGSNWRGTFTFQYQFSDRWLVASTTLIREGDGELKIAGVNVHPVAGNVEVLNAFQLQGQPLASYLVLLATVLVPVFIVFVLVLCIKTPMQKKKWPWVIFILLGFGSFTFNWATGQWEIGILSIKLLGAGFAKASPYAPVVLSFGFPLGAAMFLARRKQLAIPASETEAEQSEF